MEREQIPLRMFKGNIHALLNGTLHLNGISFERDPEVKNGVILIVHGVDEESAKEIGFTTRKLGKP